MAGVTTACSRCSVLADAEALAALGKDAARTALISALMDSNENVRRLAVEAFERLDDSQAPAQLILACKAHMWKLRGEMARLDALYEDSNYGAIQAESLWNKFMGSARRDVAEALTRLGQYHSRPGDDVTIGPLLAASRDGDRDVQFLAAEVLGRLGDARAVEPLSAALKHPNGDVRRLAAEALRELGNGQGVLALIAALKDPKLNVRRDALEALVSFDKVRPRRALDALILVLRDLEYKDPDRDMRRRAAEALGKLGYGKGSAPW
jgi:HEAT repeat protein